ncbi:triple gene block protein 1 [Colombian potato soil-borne virus]|uniref:Triple gene block protein 1 n=3 Tax=Pomovirus TaxID=186886 RepID=A0A0U2JSK0_9VIRU|nr:triple gene block protein 1 [Colombian potato soil-borne virus]ALT22303.1 triple gene block protein 1 [Colombian potato soil-borne virus]ALT22310.1 triple gene block protein 1 [Colombian potato soil-borne virus]
MESRLNGSRPHGVKKDRPIRVNPVNTQKVTGVGLNTRKPKGNISQNNNWKPKQKSVHRREGDLKNSNNFEPDLRESEHIDIVEEQPESPVAETHEHYPESSESFAADTQEQSSEPHHVLEDTKQSKENTGPGVRIPEESGGHLGSANYLGRRQLDFVTKLCVESGFKSTGKPLKRYPAEFFKSSGLLEKFDKYLSSRLDKGCNLSQRESEVVLRNLRQKRAEQSFLAGAITGVPGCGKTTLLRKIQCEGGFNSFVILGNPRSKTEFSNLPSCYTAKEILLLGIAIKCEVLLIDEYTLLTSGEILLLQKITNCRILLLFGDRAQGSSNTLSSPEWLQIPVIFQSTTSRRFGKATANLCKRQGFDFEGGDHEDKVVESPYEGSSAPTDINIVFSEDTRRDLGECGIESTLVSDVQGKEYNTVTLFIQDEDRSYLANAHLRSVAFSRHRFLLEIRCNPELFMQLINGELASEQQPQTDRYGPE